MCLVVIARAEGLTAADLGLARPAWRSGLRWGLAAAALVGAAYAVASLARPCGRPLPDGHGGLGRGLLTAVLITTDE